MRTDLIDIGKVPFHIFFMYRKLSLGEKSIILEKVLERSATQCSVDKAANVSRRTVQNIDEELFSEKIEIIELQLDEVS